MNSFVVRAFADEQGDSADSDGVDMTKRIAVVGGGIAGAMVVSLLERWNAERAEKSALVWIRGRSGASALSSGVLDADEDEILTGTTRNIFAELTGATLDNCFVATDIGTFREAKGRLPQILLLPRARGRILVASGFIGFDAKHLSRSLYDDAKRVGSALAFEPTRRNLRERTEERHMSGASLAAAFDLAERQALLLQSLREELQYARTQSDLPVVGVLFPPVLGIRTNLAALLTGQLGLPVGEVVGGVSGPYAARYEAMMEPLRARVTAVEGWVTGCELRDSAISLAVVKTGEDDAQGIHACDKLVLATGGLVGGGFSYAGGQWIGASPTPSHARSTFRSSLIEPTGVDLPGSLFGEAPESLAWPYVSGDRMRHLAATSPDPSRVWVVGALNGKASWLSCVKDAERVVAELTKNP